MNYQGGIIEESLENTDVLKSVKILSTKISPVTEEHRTPWIKQWTSYRIEVAEDQAKNVSQQISQSLDSKHSWYADFKNDTHHYIIYRNRVFCVDRKSKEQYDEAEHYGRSLGIPEDQLINYEGEYKDAI